MSSTVHFSSASLSSLSDPNMKPVCCLVKGLNRSADAMSAETERRLKQNEREEPGSA